MPAQSHAPAALCSRGSGRFEAADLRSPFQGWIAPDILVAAKDALEKQRCFRLGDLFSVTVDVVFYDLTSAYCGRTGS